MVTYHFTKLESPRGTCEADWYGLRACSKRARYLVTERGGLLCSGCKRKLVKS